MSGAFQRPEGLPEGPEGLSEGPEGLSEGSEDLTEESEGRPDRSGAFQRGLRVCQKDIKRYQKLKLTFPSSNHHHQRLSRNKFANQNTLFDLT